ncbi:CRISPR-associated endonuclease Cas2 [Endozoicomonas sp. 2B-B]
MAGIPVLICYDIKDQKSRNKALYRLRKICDSRQKSVFECWLNEQQLQEIYWQLTPLLSEEDSLFWVPVSCSRKIIRLGQSDSLLFTDFLLVA